MPIYKNVAFPNVAFQSLSTSGAANTSTTPTVTISKDGGAPAAASNAPTHVGGGHWKIDLSQAEMNANVVVLTATASGCVPSQREFYTEADYTSARAALLANLDAAISSRATAAAAAAAIIASIDAEASVLLTSIADKTDLMPGAWPTNLNLLSIDASGRVVVQPLGLDPVVIETGINLRQALAPILGAAAGKIAGSNPGGGTVTVKGGGEGNNTTRITAETDQYGNRTSAVLNLPS